MLSWVRLPAYCEERDEREMRVGLGVGGEVGADLLFERETLISDLGEQELLQLGPQGRPGFKR